MTKKNPFPTRNQNVASSYDTGVRIETFGAVMGSMPSLIMKGAEYSQYSAWGKQQNPTVSVTAGKGKLRAGKEEMKKITDQSNIIERRRERTL
jgi:hypothetical protein